MRGVTLLPCLPFTLMMSGGGTEETGVPQLEQTEKGLHSGSKDVTVGSPCPNTLSNSSRTETVRSDASSVIAALHWHPSETRNFPHAWAACVAHGTSQNHRCRCHERTVLCKLPGSCQDPRRERSEKREPLRKCVVSAVTDRAPRRFAARGGAGKVVIDLVSAGT